MQVPEADVVCRFLRPKRDWSEEERRPKPGAFKDPALSVWHPVCLQAAGDRLEDLQFASLERTGQAHYSVGDICQTAREVVREAEPSETGRLDVAVEWSPDTVFEAWKRWAYAHIEVRTDTDCKALWACFRRALCFRAQDTIPPPLEADAESVSS